MVRTKQPIAVKRLHINDFASCQVICFACPTKFALIIVRIGEVDIFDFFQLQLCVSEFLTFVDRIQELDAASIVHNDELDVKVRQKIMEIVKVVLKFAASDSVRVNL